MRALILTIVLALLSNAPALAQGTKACNGAPEPISHGACVTAWTCTAKGWEPQTTLRNGSLCTTTPTGKGVCERPGTSTTPICETTYTVGGTVSGLAAGQSVTLSNGGALVALSANGPFAVFGGLLGGAGYNVTVVDEPANQLCAVTDGSGQIGTSSVSTVSVKCLTIAAPPATGWTQLANQVPSLIGTMHLLSDGSVMAQGNSNQLYTSVAWYRLSPDSNGHFVYGTWSKLASSHCPHSDAGIEQILLDGRFFVAGGEQGAPGANDPSAFPGCATPGMTDAGTDTEIYDPVADQWTIVTVSTNLLDESLPAASDSGCIGGQQAFGDTPSELLPDGSVLMTPLYPQCPGDTLRFDPTGNAASVTALASRCTANQPATLTVNPQWSFAGTLANNACNQSESSWVKLQDGSILTADPGLNQTWQRYIPAGLYPGVSAGWIGGNSLTGVYLMDNVIWEQGPAFLLPNGNAVFFGSTPYTAIYVPANGASPGSWLPGPPMPTPPNPQLNCASGMPDAPGAMMPDGIILVEVSASPTCAGVQSFPTGIYFYTFDYSSSTAGSFTQVPAPNGLNTNVSTDGSNMLLLPDGTVLYSANGAPALYVYSDGGTPLALGRPTITSVNKNADGSYLLTGSGLNGISEGASFGDDAGVASNYPLVRLTSATDGSVRYARTHNWSGTGVKPLAPGTTDFSLPQGVAPGTYYLQLVANGNPSMPVFFTVPALNACGGLGVLASAPGAPCGSSCGRLACNGQDALMCRSYTNACGGCSSVPIAPGEGPQPGQACTCPNGSKGRLTCLGTASSCDCAP
jgi:hypothetical protein